MREINSYFRNRKMAIATKHGKERVIAPAVKDRLRVRPFVPPDLDTDILGTFSGEVERNDGPVETLRKKCELAMNLTGCDLIIASEGSFGPYSQMPLVCVDDEVLMLKDFKLNLEIIAREVSLNTNFSASYIDNENQLYEFASRTLFPSHGLIVRNAEDSFSFLYKGITDWTVLSDQYALCKARYGSVFVETDMRALYNPTRMSVIEKVAEKLIDKALSACSECGMPGYCITDYQDGLPCSLCGSPTKSVLFALFKCSHCGFSHEHFFPNEKETEDPMYCDFCNP